MKDALPEKVMSLGDLVSLSYRKFRIHRKIFWQALIWPAIASSLGCLGAGLCFSHWVKIASKSQLAFAPFAVHMGIAMLCVFVWIMGGWNLLTRSSALNRVMLGLNPDFGEAFKWIKSRSLPFIYAYSIIVVPPLVSLFLWTFVAFMFVSFIPSQQPFQLIVGSLGFGVIGFGLTVSLALSSLFGALLVAVIGAEQESFTQCLNRAIYFFRQRMMRGGSFICLLTLSLVVVYIAVYAPLIILSGIDMYSVVQFKKDTGWSEAPPIMVLEAVLDICFNVVSYGVAFTSYGLYYRDLRLRLEGDDILKKMDHISAQ